MLREIKAKVILKGTTLGDVAKEMNLSKTALYRKMYGKTEFTRKEISKIMDILDIEPKEAMEIFFNKEVS